MFFISDIFLSYNYETRYFRIHLIQPKAIIVKLLLNIFGSSPDTTLSRYDISWMPSYVSLPPCLLSTCRISALRLCWISGWNASSYRAKLRLPAEVSYPAIRKVNACATNKLPSISEKLEQTFVTVSKLSMSSSYVSLFLNNAIQYFEVNFLKKSKTNEEDTYFLYSK